MKRKLLSLLVLLMTAVTGAWAQEQSETIVTTDYIVEGTHFTISNNGNWADEDGMCADYGITVTPKNGETITKVVISNIYDSGYVNDGNTSVSSGTKEITNGGGTITVTGVNASTFTFTCSDGGPQFGQFVVYYTEAPAGPTVVASGDCGTTGHESEVTWSLTSDGVLTISGTGEMAECDPAPWDANKNVITSIVIEEGVTTIADNAFEECDNVESVSIPASVTSIGGSAFSLAGTSATTMTVTIAAGSNLATIGGDAFSFCSSLETITIPSSVTTIGMRAFVMSGLTSVTLSDGLKVIDGRAFMRCPMTTITIPASVTSIGESAFFMCSNLATVTLNSNPFIRENAFAGIADGAAVTMNLTANSAAGANWTTFYNQYYPFQADTNTQIFKAALSGSTLTLTELTTDKIVNMNNAVILKSTASPIVMTLKTTDGSNDFTGNALQGVNDPAGLTADDPSTTFVLNYTPTNGVGFYKLATGSTVGVGKAYLTYSGTLARGFFGFDETTSIESVNENEGENGEVYDLQGRRVVNPTKGLYIVNGKKVFINK